MSIETKKWLGGYVLGFASALLAVAITELIKFVIWGQAFIQANL